MAVAVLPSGATFTDTIVASRLSIWASCFLSASSQPLRPPSLATIAAARSCLQMLSRFEEVASLCRSATRWATSCSTPLKDGGRGGAPAGGERRGTQTAARSGGGRGPFGRAQASARSFRGSRPWGADSLGAGWPWSTSHPPPAAGSRAPSASPRPPRSRPGPRSPAASTCWCAPPPARARRWPRSCGRWTGWSPRSSRTRASRVVYVSPLKALAYDIERNLRAPLKGIGAEDIRVGIRTGDTPQRERAAMARNPPDILVTTPESLYLILTSQARTMLDGRPGGDRRRDPRRRRHQARLPPGADARAPRAAGCATEPPPARRPDLQRIGLSATQNPLEEVARFLGGPRREVTIVDAGIRKPLDLRIEVPVESMSRPDGRAGSRPRPAATRPSWRGGRARNARSGRRSTRSCCARCASTTRRSSSSTTAVRPSGWRCA